MYNISPDPFTSDLDLLDMGRELYDRVHKLGISDTAEIQRILKAAKSKPKPIIPKFKFASCEAEERKPPQPLEKRLITRYNSLRVRDIDGSLICGDMPKKRVPGRILRLTKALLDQPGQGNEELRVLTAWRVAIIQYLLSQVLEPPKFGNTYETSLSKPIEQFVREVIEYGQTPPRGSTPKALNP